MNFQRVPLATYRLQLNTKFGFRDAIGILDYLRDLGISHVYTSPVLTARTQSGHGYDVTDPTTIDAGLGGEEGFRALQSALEERGLALLLDIVPNHMAASSENRWWMDVLEYGPDSPFAFYFDIDWRAQTRMLENKLLLPFLGKPFAEVLDAGEIQIRCEDGRLLIQYGEQLFPVAPRSYSRILRERERELDSALDPEAAATHEWRGILAVAELITIDRSVGTQAAAERRASFQHMRERLRQLLEGSPHVSELLAAKLQALNGNPGEPGSFRELESILAHQHYRLAFWQTSTDAINYRRFFSITDLVGVRVEDPAVFDATHEAAIRVGFKPGFTSFRIDHIDGLRNPLGYLTRLEARLASDGAERERPYLVVEKILEAGELLPDNWPVAGTTGYDYLNVANRLLVDGRQANALTELYARWTNQRVNFDDLLYEKKRVVLRTLLGVETRSLARQLAELARDDRYARELDPREIMEALVEVTACLPVYRTYIQSLEVPEDAQRVIAAALQKAQTRRAHLPPGCFTFVADVLSLAAKEHIRPEQREARLAFVTRWQQFTGPVFAKGLEDTALYVYFPLASLNEVGGEPTPGEASPADFHHFIATRRTKWPYSLNATTTHDTKRSEDTRARISVLSEIPDEWERALQEWSSVNAKYIHSVNGNAVPDRNEEYLLYQTLVGIWPLVDEDWPTLVQRVQDYILKAIREAMIHTRWTRPNEAHESALRDFIERVIDREQNATFCSAFAQFQEKTALYGMMNGLGQTLLKVACPGVPDIYQGSDLWDLRLVDPDNRGPVDFTKRAGILAGLRNMAQSRCARCVQELLANWRDGRLKLHVLTRALNARRRNPALFLDGDYKPLEAQGLHQDRVVAFARSSGDDWAIAVVPRCIASVGAPVVEGDRRKFWGDTVLHLPDSAPKTWFNALVGPSSKVISSEDHRISLGDAFCELPIALLLPNAA